MRLWNLIMRILTNGASWTCPGAHTWAEHLPIEHLEVTNLARDSVSAGNILRKTIQQITAVERGHYDCVAIVFPNIPARREMLLTDKNQIVRFVNVNAMAFTKGADHPHIPKDILKLMEEHFVRVVTDEENVLNLLMSIYLTGVFLTQQQIKFVIMVDSKSLADTVHDLYGAIDQTAKESIDHYFKLVTEFVDPCESGLGVITTAMLNNTKHPTIDGARMLGKYITDKILK